MPILVLLYLQNFHRVPIAHSVGAFSNELPVTFFGAAMQRTWKAILDMHHVIVSWTRRLEISRYLDIYCGSGEHCPDLGCWQLWMATLIRTLAGDEMGHSSLRGISLSHLHYIAALAMAMFLNKLATVRWKIIGRKRKNLLVK